MLGLNVGRHVHCRVTDGIVLMKQYLELVRNVITNGECRSDRTGTGTRSLFAPPALSFDLSPDYLPLVTTKKVHVDSVMKELFWFLRGETNTQTLGCGIWDEWATADGELGPIYGHQWRRSEGIDQVGNVVRELHNNPQSRRLIVNAWNPRDLPKMALPPCHVMWQLYVRGEKYLDLFLYQRSGDLGLGVPFNIASYALLTHLIARSVGLTAGRFTYQLGDAHVYENHVAALEGQLTRTPSSIKPRVEILKRPDFSHPDRWNITLDDVRVTHYKPQAWIKMEVAV